MKSRMWMSSGFNAQGVFLFFWFFFKAYVISKKNLNLKHGQFSDFFS